MLSVAVGSVTLISRFVLGLVLSVLLVLGGGVCPIVCLYCWLVLPAYVFTLIFTSISLAWFGVVSLPFPTGSVCTLSCLQVPRWLFVCAQWLAVPVPFFLCLSSSFAVLSFLLVPAGWYAVPSRGGACVLGDLVVSKYWYPIVD